MIEVLRKIIANVLEALYQPFGFAVVIAVLFTFLYIFAKEYGWKNVIQKWIQYFKSSVIFRRVFLLTIYVAMITFRTLLNRHIWANPLSDVIGVWGLYNANGELTTEAIENLVLFIPFTVLLLLSFQNRLLGDVVKISAIIWKSTVIVFCYSITIEFLQLFLRLGTFQLSDLFYNTLGGLIGGFIYWCGYKIAHRNNKDNKD